MADGTVNTISFNLPLASSVNLSSINSFWASSITSSRTPEKPWAKEGRVISSRMNGAKESRREELEIALVEVELETVKGVEAVTKESIEPVELVDALRLCCCLPYALAKSMIDYSNFATASSIL